MALTSPACCTVLPVGLVPAVVLVPVELVSLVTTLSLAPPVLLVSWMVNRPLEILKPLAVAMPLAVAIAVACRFDTLLGGDGHLKTLFTQQQWLMCLPHHRRCQQQ